MLSVHRNDFVESWRNFKDPQRITKFKPFINKYNLEGIN